MPINNRRCFMSFIISASIVLASGCMSKEAGYSEQQKRMVRCDQYIGDAREACLRGEAVTIDDYQEDLREFHKDEKKKREESLPKPVKDEPN